MSSEEEQLEGLLRSNNPAPAVSFTLMLLRGRSMLRVQQALLARYPTEESFEQLLHSPTYLELVEEVSTVFADMRLTSGVIGNLADPEDIQAAVMSHYPRAEDACVEFAALLGVDVVDLLSVLLVA